MIPPDTDVQPSVRGMTQDDVAFAVAAHERHFPAGFFAQLGSTFLRAYYLSFVTSPDAHTIVAVVDDEPVGYLVGSVHPEAHRRHVYAAHGQRLLLLGLLALAVRPRLAVVFLRTRALRYARPLFLAATTRLRRRACDSPRSGASPAAGVVHHFVVLSEWRGTGVGAALLRHFDGALSGRGVERIVLVTETGGLGDHYYRANGWTVCSTHCSPDGRSLTTFSRSVVAAHDSPGEHSA